MDGGRENNLLSVKMRASRAGRHVSGAERIVAARDVPAVAAALASRALNHPLAEPDLVNVKIETLASAPLRIDALPVAKHEAESVAAGRETAATLLAQAGVGRADGAWTLFESAGPMRGAMVVDADTLERLDGRGERGVRATRMDADPPAASVPERKDHFAEALVLASKVCAAKGIVAELCISDDPDYTTGYVASPSLGYRRISPLKEKGASAGGRIFFFRGSPVELDEAIRFLEETPVLVRCGAAENAPADSGDPVAPYAAALENRRQEGLERKCRTVETRTGAFAIVEGRRLDVMSSNNYLDLASDPRVVSAATNAARQWGAGTGGARLLTGTQTPHVELERAIAAFKGAEDAVLYATGYMANVGVLSALAAKGDEIFSDALNHASIIDGCRISGAAVSVYRHLDFDDLERRLDASRAKRKIVVSDGVFSMDGDVLDLPRFTAAARRHGALSIVDEAHATGVVGKTGRGLCELFGCEPPDVATGTFSKALGSSGGFACCSRTLAEYLRSFSRPFVFSTSPGAPQVGAALAALKILEEEPRRVERLRENVEFFVSELARRGIAAESASAIVPVPVGDERRALAAAAFMEKEGFLVPAIRYPTVARGAARLRFSFMSSHARPRIALAADAVARALAADGAA